ncbi:serine hydrolase [soil metagenome]
MTRILLLLLLAACTAAPSPKIPVPSAAARLPALEAELRELIRGYAADTAEVAVAFKDLAGGDSLLIDAHTTMHAASTMKVPVMLELFRRAEAGELSLDEPVPVRNEFRSIADGSSYSLTVSDDSEHGLYGQLGERVPLRRLMELMITHSSNLATNLLIDLADPRRIARTLDEIGASEMRVLRGVEDIPAFERGMNNSTTAYGFMKVLEGVAAGRVVSARSTEEMLRILEGQEFQEMIPAGLPPGTRVGNKTGWITRIQHDGAIVYPPNRPPYVLVVLTRGFTDRERAAELGREISRRVYRALTEG